jgi:hypothetical protein
MAQPKTATPPVPSNPDSQVTVGGNKYLIKRLNTFEQFEIARKLSPVLAMLAMQTDKNKLAEHFPQAYCALTAGLDPADIERINRLVFGAVLREQQGHFVPVYVSGMLAFNDIDMQGMLELIWAVLDAHRLPDFFTGSLSSLESLRL